MSQSHSLTSFCIVLVVFIVLFIIHIRSRLNRCFFYAGFYARRSLRDAAASLLLSRAHWINHHWQPAIGSQHCRQTHKARQQAKAKLRVVCSSRQPRPSKASRQSHTRLKAKQRRLVGSGRLHGCRQLGIRIREKSLSIGEASLLISHVMCAYGLVKGLLMTQDR